MVEERWRFGDLLVAGGWRQNEKDKGLGAPFRVRDKELPPLDLTLNLTYLSLMIKITIYSL